jgi:hypothetical protein
MDLKTLKAQNSWSQATCLDKTTHGLNLEEKLNSYKLNLGEEVSSHELSFREESNAMSLA